LVIHHIEIIFAMTYAWQKYHDPAALGGVTSEWISLVGGI